jgi:hypothetical protein
MSVAMPSLSEPDAAAQGPIGWSNPGVLPAASSVKCLLCPLFHFFFQDGVLTLLNPEWFSRYAYAGIDKE